MRDAGMASAEVASRTWLTTAPFFCANPVKSSTVAALPSAFAAAPSNALARACSASASGLRKVAPSSSTKLGQKPLVQEKSLLHAF